MKTLYLVRHAKSSWEDGDLSDEKRPLNSRGKHDAPFMGEILFKKNILPEIIISSYAKRALSTAKIIAEKINYPDDKIISSDTLYMANVNELLEVISQIDDKYNCAMLFGHNPGITHLVNYLSNTNIDNVPTCGIVCIKLDITSWSHIARKNGELMFFEYPKKNK